MDYKMGIKPKKFKHGEVVLRLRFEGDGDDAGFIYRAITFAMGNPKKADAFILQEQGLLDASEEDGNAIGFQ